MLSRKQVSKNIDWLMKNASAPVRYLTFRDLVCEGRDSGKLEKLWHEVEEDSEITEIFAKQKEDGSWCSGGSWALPPAYIPKGGCTPVSPKYVTTAWILALLGDMGFCIRDKRINKACEYILSFQCKNGFIAEDNVKKFDVEVGDLHNMPCRFSIMLIALGKVGAGNDRRVRDAYNLLIKWQREDGGWILQKHKEERNWARSCPWSTYHATAALYASNNKEYNSHVKKGLCFLLQHLSQKDEGDIKRFFYHGHSTIHEIIMFSESGIAMASNPISTLISWLMEMYDEKEGCFIYRGKPISKFSRRKDGMDPRVAKYRLYHLIERDWLTYYMTKIIAHQDDLMLDISE
jgi:hypothetical protein